MGTLYDLLGALPSDNAESLRTAFRKAAKHAHPDINSDDPDASLRFRELVRAYEILTDTEQRATYDQLLAIALHPPATKPAHTYERIHKLASSTMAATIISGVLIGGYTLFGHFSKPPSAAEIVTALNKGGPEIAAAVPAAQPDAGAPVEPRAEEGKASVDEIVTAAVTSAVNENRASTIGGIDLASGLTLNDLVIQHDPGFAEADTRPAVVLYRMREFDRAFANLPPAKRLADSNRARISAATRPKPLPMRVPLPPRRMPITAALTP